MSIIIPRLKMALPAVALSTVSLLLSLSLGLACEAAAPAFLDGPMDPTVDGDIDMEPSTQPAEKSRAPLVLPPETEVRCASAHKVPHLAVALAWTAAAGRVDWRMPGNAVTQGENDRSPCDE